MELGVVVVLAFVILHHCQVIMASLVMMVINAQPEKQFNVMELVEEE
jgi:hypothetical protein